MGIVVTPVQALGKHDPQEAKAWCESRAWILLLLYAMLADRELALDGEELCRQNGFGLYQSQKKRHCISEDLPGERNCLPGIAQPFLNRAHSDRIHWSKPRLRDDVSPCRIGGTGLFGWTAICWPIRQSARSTISGCHVFIPGTEGVLGEGQVLDR